jgi:hypothetical protein
MPHARAANYIDVDTVTTEIVPDGALAGHIHFR